VAGLPVVATRSLHTAGEDFWEPTVVTTSDAIAAALGRTKA
jgi:hypothetical protein